MNAPPGDPRLKLDDVYAQHAAPPAQEARVMDAYWSHHRGARSRGGMGVWGRRVATWVFLFGAGFLAAGRFQPPLEEATGSRFMLLMWQGPDFAGGNTDADLSLEYAAWARRVGGEGVALEGSEFAPSHELVGVTGQAEASQESRLGGFFIVSSPDMAAARRIAQGHPHLTHGGWIEVAPLR